MDFADRTHTADKILLYEGQCCFWRDTCWEPVFDFSDRNPVYEMAASGIRAYGRNFCGMLGDGAGGNIEWLPVFIRRVKIVRYIPLFIAGMAIGKGLGACLFFSMRW